MVIIWLQFPGQWRITPNAAIALRFNYLLQRRQFQTHSRYVNGATGTNFEERIGLDNQATSRDAEPEAEAAAV